MKRTTSTLYKRSFIEKMLNITSCEISKLEIMFSIKPNEDGKYTEEDMLKMKQYVLSEREQTPIRIIPDYVSIPEVASILDVHERTARNYLSDERIWKKYGFKDTQSKKRFFKSCKEFWKEMCE